MTALLVLTLNCALLGASDETAVNPLFNKMIKTGIDMPGAEPVRLTTPIMNESMTSMEQEQALAATAAKAKASMADFTAKDSSAPMFIKVRTLHTNPTFRVIDIAFVARGKWSVLNDQKFGDDILKARKPGNQAGGNRTVVSSGILTQKEMDDRHLVPDDAGDPKNPNGTFRKEGWLQTTFDLFDQAEVSATRKIVVTRTPRSVTVAAEIDPKFDHDSMYPNQWRTITPGNVPPLGEPNAYGGAGFYIRVIKLEKPDDAIFCEYHGTFYEPLKWFDGTNLIHSKLPLAAGFQAKQFRGKLAMKSQQADGDKPADETKTNETTSASQ